MSRSPALPGDDAPPIAARLTSLERVMGVIDGRVDDSYLRSARDVTRQITERLSLSPAHTVVALAGATGSGKSSLFNALAGLDLSEVGVRRPVTNAPHACVWGPDGAGPLLDWLSIPYDNRTTRESALDADTQSELRGLVLLDLPDHDSTQLAHRLEVDRLVELVDLLVWVLDPQKYADEAVHSRYLRRLSRHAGVTVVVLNQVDLLSDADAEACLADVRRLLDADGLRGVPLVPLSALRGDGLPELRKRITATVSTRQAALRRLAADLDGVADELAPLAGPEVREDVDRGAAKRLYTTLAEAAGVTAVGEAVERGYKFSANRSLGWPLIHWFGRAKADPLAPLRENAGKAPRRSGARPAVLHPVQRPQVEEALRDLTDDATSALPVPWPGLVHQAARSELDSLPDALDRAVATADLGLARRPGWWWLYRGVQYLVVLALLGGIAWTLGLAIAAAVSRDDNPSGTGSLALPVGLLLTGLLLGPILHVVGIVLAGRGARAARMRAEQAVLDAVTPVARERVLAPVRAELSAYARVRDALGELGVSVPQLSSTYPVGELAPAVLPAVPQPEALEGAVSLKPKEVGGLGPLPSATNYPDPFQPRRPDAPPAEGPGPAGRSVADRPGSADRPKSADWPGAADRPAAAWPAPSSAQRAEGASEHWAAGGPQPQPSSSPFPRTGGPAEHWAAGNSQPQPGGSLFQPPADSGRQARPSDTGFSANPADALPVRPSRGLFRSGATDRQPDPADAPVEPRPTDGPHQAPPNDDRFSPSPAAAPSARPSKGPFRSGATDGPANSTDFPFPNRPTDGPELGRGADGPGLGRAADGPGLGRAADGPGQGRPADRPGQGRPADRPGLGRAADRPGLGRAADRPGLGRAADRPGQGSEVDRLEQARRADGLRQGRPIDGPGQGRLAAGGGQVQPGGSAVPARATDGSSAGPNASEPNDDRFRPRTASGPSARSGDGSFWGSDAASQASSTGAPGQPRPRALGAAHPTDERRPQPSASSPSGSPDTSPTAESRPTGLTEPAPPPQSPSAPSHQTLPAAQAPGSTPSGSTPEGMAFPGTQAPRLAPFGRTPAGAPSPGEAARGSATPPVSSPPAPTPRPAAAVDLWTMPAPRPGRPTDQPPPTAQAPSWQSNAPVAPTWPGTTPSSPTSPAASSAQPGRPIGVTNPATPDGSQAPSWPTSPQPSAPTWPGTPPTGREGTPTSPAAPGTPGAMPSERPAESGTPTAASGGQQAPSWPAPPRPSGPTWPGAAPAGHDTAPTTPAGHETTPGWSRSAPPAGPQSAPPAGPQSAPPAGPQSAPPAGPQSAPPAGPRSAPPAAPGAASPAGLQSAPPAGPRSAPPAGLQSAGPQSAPPAGPRSAPPAGPQSAPPAGPRSAPPAGPQSAPPAGPRSAPPAGPQSAGPQSAGPQSAGPQSAGPQSGPPAGPRTAPPAGPQSAPPAGPRSAPPAGLQSAGLQSAGLPPAGPTGPAESPVWPGLQPGSPESPNLASGPRPTRRTGAGTAATRPSLNPPADSTDERPARASRGRRPGANLPPAPPPRPAVEADPEVAWERTRHAARPSPFPAPESAPPKDEPKNSRPAETDTDADADTGSGRKGRRGLFGRRKEAADVVDRWWAGEDDGEDPFGRPPTRDEDDTDTRPRVPGQR
ncbi:GTPase [Cryptosporangium sp. NPDC051539]|uniref:GTPase n=1 Tax=Cryptosporangium sp. NPDC051539 TaxID=3363962 RepID=UPI0037BD9D91